MTRRIPEVRLSWPAGQVFLDHLVEGPPARLSYPWPDTDPIPRGAVPGALVATLQEFRDRDTRFRVHACIVEWHLTRGDSKLVLELLPEERDRLELLLASASGESLPYWRRSHERIPIDLPVRITTASGEERNCRASDLSERGAHLAIDPVLALEERIELDFKLPSGKRVSLRGRVVAVIPRGPQQGAGVEFLFSSRKQQQQIADECERLRSSRGE